MFCKRYIIHFSFLKGRHYVLSANHLLSDKEDKGETMQDLQS